MLGKRSHWSAGNGEWEMGVGIGRAGSGTWRFPIPDSRFPAGHAHRQNAHSPLLPRPSPG
ncbi:hypothetical protein NX08_018055 [Xanthomonas vasicola]|nr:hypothetical protein NX08_018055 [Xanthomonas vasicola]